jgi:C4-dicarboxylate transporter DctQ subunit
VHYKPAGRISRWVNEIEEIGIAVLLGAMTFLTFANVVARYILETNILWALEATTYLFAWLVLFGVSYAVKISAHLGVDAIIVRLSPGAQKVLALISVTACLLFTGLLLYGGWDYWYKFFTKLAFLEVEDVPFPAILQSMVGLVEDGEPVYENFPRYIPYFILPFGMALLLFRYLQATWRIWKGEQTLLIASHEVDDMMEEMENELAKEER